MGTSGPRLPEAAARRRPPIGWTACLLVFATALDAGPASAQTAADKATAREAATEGIKLFRAGKYADALDRLRRAQALYDAPVHLLYIARAQDKLGQLVEAAENYRLLDHYALGAGAPEAWTSAVDDGRKELALLEPRIPKLEIRTDPVTVRDAALQIDGATVSAAVVGIERPLNPGKHHVAISAPSFGAAEADAELAEGQSRELTLHLTAGGSTPVAAAPTASGGPAPAASDKGKGRSLVGFLGGLRLGVGVPVGTLLRTQEPAPTDLSVTDGFGPGGALELHAGVRIARYFTPVLYLEGEALAPGDGFRGRGKVRNTVAGALGIGLIAGSAPNKLGGFGELDLALTSFGLTAPALAGKSCDLTAKGGALRIGGGAIIPVLDWLELTPVFLATIGRFTTVSQSGDCTLYPSAPDIPSDNRATHALLFFGVGGDVVLGNDK